MNAGEDFNGREIDAPTSFFLGVAVNPAADDLELELERFERKLEAGAQFAMTQVLFDLSYLEAFLERLGGSCPIPLLVGVFYVRSYQLALRLHNEVPGIVVPEHVQERLRDAGADAAETGLAIARELLEASRELAAGVYVIPPFRQPHAALDLFSGGAVRGSDRPRLHLREHLLHEVGRDPVTARLAWPAGEDRRAYVSLGVDTGAT